MSNLMHSNLNLVASSIQAIKNISASGSELIKIKSTRKPTLSYLELFQFATKFEKFLTIFGVILAILVSSTYALDIVVYSEYTTLLMDRTQNNGSTQRTTFINWFGGGRFLPNADAEENKNAIREDSNAYFIAEFSLAGMQLVMLAISIYIINYSALRQIQTIRVEFLKAVIRQDMSWFDINRYENFAVRVSDDLDKLRDGISEKMTMCFYLFGSGVFSLATAVLYGWKLSLVLLATTPLIFMISIFVGNRQNYNTVQEMKSYAVAGSHAEQVINGVRTVVAFGGEKIESTLYENSLRVGEQNGMYKGAYTGFGNGSLWFLIYSSYAIALWYGVQLMLADRSLPEGQRDYTPKVLIMILLGVIGAAVHFGLSLPLLETFNSARGAASYIYGVINRKSSIDPISSNGFYPDSISGRIEFHKVVFRYPARPETPILTGLDLIISSGTTVALVGSSGCGKSTCLQLIQRLYDPLEGYLTIDGYQIKDLNVAWLRTFIGVVGQEPVLFDTTIGENIRYGNPDANMTKIENAARIANCHRFIMRLPKGYSTMVGEGGAQLSGGQKQRIAIARALVRNPKILLLDEATSALDTNSEKIVQEALERAMKGRTTLVVSHRLSTVTNADQIVFMHEGKVVEMGTHAELMEKQGEYYELVNASGSGTRNKKGAYDCSSYANGGRLFHCIFSLSPLETLVFSGESAQALVQDDRIGGKSQANLLDQKYKVSMGRMLRYCAPEWMYILFGCLAAGVIGVTFPVFAVLYGEMYGVMGRQKDEDVRAGGYYYSLMFVTLAFVAGLSAFMQPFLLQLAGIKLTTRLRVKCLEAIMSQDMAWFDDPKNSVGALCTRLSSDCADVQGATGTRIGFIIQSVASIITGVVIAFFISWELTFISIISIPLILGTVYVETRFTTKNALQEKLANEKGVKIAVEAIANIKTVASLGQEKYVIQRYKTEMEYVYQYSLKKSRFRGLILGLGNVVPHFGYGITLTYGGYMVAKDELYYKDLIIMSEAFLFGAWMLGQALAFMPNVNSAIIAASRIFSLLDRKPGYINPDVSPVEPNWKTDGSVSYHDVRFRYPTRQNIPVLQGLNMHIQSGQTVALVGQSGCGKSTCMQLLMRYYDPDSGSVLLDGRPTTDYPLYVIRSQLGLVSQEPVLFDRSIADNIAYGDNTRHIPMAELVAAARLANIHDFIVNLPFGYDTNLGTRGAHLSGGQKQRIAIARALVRNPPILLLDEATSALDNQSEKVVQLALDRAKKGRTCITIAHRLTTIQNSDMILVFQNGVVVEQGKHDELIKMDGLYATLYSMQQIAT